MCFLLPQFKSSPLALQTWPHRAGTVINRKRVKKEDGHVKRICITPEKETMNLFKYNRQASRREKLISRATYC